MITNNKTESSFPWSSRFIGIVEKSLRKMHHDFLLWNIGTAQKSDRILKYNQGIGIELADETYVSATVTQEAIGSSLFSGDYVNESDFPEGTRYWLVDRERTYVTKNDNDNLIKCDLYINRYEIKDNEVVPSRTPVYIEAKRARRHSAKDISIPNLRENPYSFLEIKNDINRLIKEKKEFEKNELGTMQYDSIYPYILVWGVFLVLKEDNEHNLKPSEFQAKLEQENVTLIQRECRWVPISTKSKDGDEVPEVDKWLWILLIECREKASMA